MITLDQLWSVAEQNSLWCDAGDLITVETNPRERPAGRRRCRRLPAGWWLSRLCRMQPGVHIGQGEANVTTYLVKRNSAFRH
jgi:hypothetical protein